jgi:hypothetical protein
VVAGSVVVSCVVVVLVCANANGAINAHTNIINVFFIILPFVFLDSLPANSTDAPDALT